MAKLFIAPKVGELINNCAFLKILEVTKTKKGYDRKCLFKCFCGNTFISRIESLKSGHANSCGCYHKARLREILTTHGESKNKQGSYKIWEGIKGRCTSTIHRDYPEYAGRGVECCQRWLDSFENFLEDMGERPSLKHSIDRIDNDKGYSKENCRWATQKEQTRNTRRNVRINYKGKEQTLVEWCEELGLKYKLIQKRIKEDKWSVERAFTTPLQTQYQRFKTI